MPPFRLRAILDLRRREVEATVTGWSRARQALAIVDEQIAHRRAAAAASDETARRLMAAGAVSLDEVLGHGRDAILARAEEAHLAGQRARIEAAVEQAHRGVLAARTKVAALEKLEERHGTAWTAAEAAREAAELQETIVRDACRADRPNEGRVQTT